MGMILLWCIILDILFYFQCRSVILVPKGQKDKFGLKIMNLLENCRCFLGFNTLYEDQHSIGNGLYLNRVNGVNKYKIKINQKIGGHLD